MPRDRDRQRKRDRDRDRKRGQKGQKGKGQKGGGAGQDPYFLRPQTRRSYLREMKAAERSEFQPEKRQLAAEARASEEQQRRIQGYFDVYGQAVEKAQQGSAAATAAAQQQIAQTTSASSAGSAEMAQALEAAARADAARRGASYDPSTANALAAGSAAARRATSDTFAQMGAVQGASQGSYLADKGRIGEGERIEQLRREAARGRTIDLDKRELAKARKDFRSEFRTQQRAEDRDFYLEQLALEDAQAGRESQLGLAKQYAKAERKSQKRSRRTQLDVIRRQSKAEKRQQRRSLQSQQAVGAAQGRRSRQEQRRSRGTQLTLQQRQERAERRDDARERRRARAAAAASGGGGSSDGYSVRQAVGFLRSADQKFGSNNAAVNYLINRGVSASVARQAVARVRSTEARGFESGGR